MRLARCLTILFLLFTAFTAFTAERMRRVLILASNHTGNAGTAELVRQIQDQLRRANFPFVVDVTTEMLDSARAPSEEAVKYRFKKILPAIKSHRYDLIIAIHDDAVEQVLENYSEKPKDVPFLFCRYEAYREGMEKDFPGMTGVTGQCDVRGLLDAVLRLMPDSKCAVILTDASKMGRELRTRLQNTLPVREGLTVKFLSGDTNPGNSLFEELAAIPSESFLILTPLHKMETLGVESVFAFTAMLATRVKAPFFITEEILMGTRTPGGFLTGNALAGNETGKMAVRLLYGEPAKSIKVRPGMVTPVFDYNELKLHHLEPTKLPKTWLRNQPESLYEKHPRIVILTVLALLVGIAATLFLLFQYRGMLRRNTGILNALPVRLGVADRQGRILFFYAPDLDEETMRAFKRVDDLSFSLQENLSSVMENVFLSRQPHTLDYVHESRRRSMTLALLSPDVFNREAIIWVSQDVSELQKLRLEQSLMAERLRITLHAIGEGVIATDCAGKITLANSAAEKLLGCEQTDALGKHLSEVFKLHDAERNEIHPVTDVLRGAVRNFSDHDLTGQNGLVRHVSDSAAPIRDSIDGTIVGGVFVFRDMTHEYEVRARLNNLVRNEQIINQCLQRITLENDFAAAVNEILSLIGRNTGVDRCFICRYSDDFTFAELQYEWDESGIERMSPDTRRLNMSLFAGARNAFCECRDLKIEDTVKETSFEMKFLRKIGAKSVLLSGIRENNIIHGFIGLMYVREKHTFSESDIMMIHGAVNLFLIARERSRQLHLIEDSIALQRQLSDTVPVAISIISKDMRLITVNTCAGEYTNQKREDLIGRPCYECFCHCDKVPDWCPVQKTYLDSKQHKAEFVDQSRSYVITAQPMFDSRMNLTSVLEMAMDVTEFEEQKKKLEKAMHDAQAASRAKSYFLATMSHELRTPLNAVIGFTELLRDRELAEELRGEYLQSIHFSGNALLNLINDVLDLSKLEANQMSVMPAENDLTELTDEMYSVFRLRASDNQIDFRVSLPENLPLFVFDSLRLRQILFNLLGNAFKFTKKGFIHINVSFTKKLNSTGFLRIDVADSGVGIALDSQKRIFDPFVQQEVVRGTRTTQGTGLGLAIARRLAECMGGSIELFSKPGCGSTFSILFPDIPFRYTEKKPLKTNANGNVETDIGNYCVLVVDDVALNRKVLEAMLRKMKQNPTCASSGHEALELLKSKHFDLVLTDLWMPKFSGVDLAKEIRLMPDGDKIAVFAVTADTEANTNFNLDSVFNGKILKPVTSEKLVSVFQKYESFRAEFSSLNIKKNT